MRAKSLLILMVLVFMFSTPAPGMAERFAELYLGSAFSQDITIDYRTETGVATGGLDFDRTFEIGYRLGYWFNQAPWLGISLDASYFQHDLDDADLTVIPISALWMLRLPLNKSNRYPTGEWQPYTAVGPCLFYNRFDRGPQDDKEWDFGLDARAGLKKMFQNFGAYVEYRYTLFSPTYDSSILNEVDIKTHHAIVGISVDF